MPETNLECAIVVPSPDTTCSIANGPEFGGSVTTTYDFVIGQCVAATQFHSYKLAEFPFGYNN